MRLFRKATTALFPLVILASLVVTFQNCQPSSLPQSVSGAQRGPSSLTSQPEFTTQIEAAQHPFRERKVQVRLTDTDPDLNRLRKAGTPEISMTQDLLIVLDNLCADESSGPLTDLVDRGERLDLEVQVYPFRLPQSVSLRQLEHLAEGDPCVVGLSHDDVVQATSVPNDPSFAQQLHLSAIGARDSFRFFRDPLRGSRSSVVVAVIDSGIDHNHPDLKNMLWKDSLGRVGHNFVSADPTVYDEFGHGTSVSGIIAAEANNGIGITGVMGHSVKIMTLKVQNSTGGSTVSLMTSAIQHATAAGVDVINISMEGSGHNASLQAALNAAITAGIVVVVAAGNGGSEISPDNFVIPAGYGSSLSGMITVGSVDSQALTRSNFSNFGASYVEIAAPGSNGIYTTAVGGGYRNTSGTSFSAPQVAGAAALVISFLKQNGIAYTPSTVENIVLASAQRRTALGSTFSNGQILDLRSLSNFLRRSFLSPIDGGFDEN